MAIIVSAGTQNITRSKILSRHFGSGNILLFCTIEFDNTPGHTKLQHYRITGQVNTSIGSFLNINNRRQIVLVLVEGASSAFVSMESGVPQGSILGPCLSFLYINDLLKNLSSTARQQQNFICILYSWSSRQKAESAGHSKDLILIGPIFKVTYRRIWKK